MIYCFHYLLAMIFEQKRCLYVLEESKINKVIVRKFDADLKSESTLGSLIKLMYESLRIGTIVSLSKHANKCFDSFFFQINDFYGINTVHYV